MKRVTNVILINERRLLMVRDREGEFWTLPGGKIERGESVTDSLKREIGEELPFLDLADIKFYKVEIGETPHSKVEVKVYFFSAKASGSIETGAEITGSCWADRETLKTLKLSGLTAKIVDSLILEERL